MHSDQNDAARALYLAEKALSLIAEFWSGRATPYVGLPEASSAADAIRV